MSAAVAPVLAVPRFVPPPAPRRTLHVTAVAYADQSAVASTRTFTQYSIYKGKAAATFKVIAPTFRQSISGPYINYQLDREGALFLEMAGVLPSAGGGSNARNYDWQNKITFALKPLELAQLTDVDNLPDLTKGIDIYHDPNKGSNDPSLVKTSKRLKLAYNPQGEGYLLTLLQNKEGAQGVNFTVPVTRAEFVVLKHLASYLIPRMLGFDMLFEGAGAVPTNLSSGGGSPGNGI